MTREMDTLPARQNGNAVVARRPVDLNAPARDTNTLKALMENQRDKLATVLPRHLTPDRLMRVVLLAVSKSRDLQDCTIGSILGCVMTSAQLGLDCSGVLGSAYMVPFFNSKTGQKEAQFVPGYRGLIDLARRSGEIEDIAAHCVYKDDEFRLELGAEPKLVHVPDLHADRQDEGIVGAYMVAYLKGNTRPHIEFVPRRDIDKVRKASKAASRGPWVDWFAEMCRKTAVRRGIKYLPMSVELSEALSLDAAADDRTEVHSASTGPAGSHTKRVLENITRRPVSEGQTFDPDPVAVAQAEQDLAHGEIVEQEPDTVGTDAEPPAEGSPAPDVSSWDRTQVALNEAAMDADLAESDLQKRVNAWLVGAGLKGKTDKVTPAQRLALVAAVREGRLDEAGKIVVAG